MKSILKQNSKFINFIVYLLFVYLLWFSFFRKPLLLVSIKNIIRIWFYYVFPSISTIFIISNFLQCFPIISKVFFLIFGKLFHFENYHACSIFLISILAGNPTACRLILRAINDKEISAEEGNRLFGFTSFVSPFFLVLMLDKKTAILLITIELFANTMEAIFSKKRIYEKDAISIHTKNVFDTYFYLVDELPKLLLGILACMLITNLISIVISSLPYPFCYLSIFLEISQGIIIIHEMTNSLIKICFLNLLITFNGVAILLQVFWSIKKTPLSFSNFIKKRIDVFIISLIGLGVYGLCIILLKLFF